MTMIKTQFLLLSSILNPAQVTSKHKTLLLSLPKMGRFCLFACTGLTNRFRHARRFFYKFASLLKLIRSEKSNVLILEKFLYDDEQKQFSKQK